MLIRKYRLQPPLTSLATRSPDVWPIKRSRDGERERDRATGNPKTTDRTDRVHRRCMHVLCIWSKRSNAQHLRIVAQKFRGSVSRKICVCLGLSVCICQLVCGSWISNMTCRFIVELGAQAYVDIAPTRHISILWKSKFRNNVIQYVPRVS